MFSRVIPAVLCAALLAQGPALAQPSEAVSKVTQLNKDALAAIDKREFEKARELLKRALDLCDESGLDRHPARARTHVHMGVVIIQGFKNHDLGKKQFSKALEIDPTITVTKSLSTPELEDAFAEAKSPGGAPSGNAADEASRAAQPSDNRGAGRPALSANGLAYHSLSEVRQGGNIVVTVNVEDTLKFSKIVLAYKPQGEREFLGREMDASGAGAYSATIPDRATGGASVAYYIEAQDEEGQPIAQRGTEERPLVISFANQPRPSSSKGADAVAEKRDARRKDDDDDGGGEGKWFAGLLVGSGIGYASGMGEVNADTKVAGTFSGALLGHFAPQIGYWVDANLMLSLQGRFQLVTGPTEVLDSTNNKTYSPVHAALAVFVKASYFLGGGALRPFLSGALGGGQIRHVVTFGDLTNCGASQKEKCVDSVVAGPLLAEVGGGLMYKLTPAIALVASTNAQVAAPKFTLNLDLNAGVGFSF